MVEKRRFLVKDKDFKKTIPTNVNMQNNNQLSNNDSQSKQKQIELFVKLHIANHRPG